MVFSRLTGPQIDALREVANVGMGHAATALSQLTGKSVHLEVPRVMLTEVDGIAGTLDSAERSAVGIQFKMLGAAQGHILMIFPEETAIKILAALLRGGNSDTRTFSELELSALKEVGNILASAYLNALGALLRMTLIPSIPILALDNAGKLVESALADFGGVGDMALVLDTQFFSRDELVNSQLFLIPAPTSLNAILNALGMAHV